MDSKKERQLVRVLKEKFQNFDSKKALKYSTDETNI